MSEAARLAFEQDAKTREGGAYADVDLSLSRTEHGYINPVWHADWLLWRRAWNAGVAAGVWRPDGVKVLSEGRDA